MQPENCISAVEDIITRNTAIEVVGISGPGEPLFNKETFDTLKLISEHFPDLKLCVCTNGLLLPEKAKSLKELNVKSLTITINAVDPKIGLKISPHSIIHGKKIEGARGARVLIENQLKGLELASELGFLMKINTVLIPDVNLGHLRDIAYEAQARGAHMLNIMPLIPTGEFVDLRPPTCDELIMIREVCESIIPIFRACKQCRADACGVPGLEERNKI